MSPHGGSGNFPSEAPTPPAYVRVVTLESLAQEFESLRARENENYAGIRNLSIKVDSNHLVTLDCLGQLARMLGFKLVVADPRELEVPK